MMVVRSQVSGHTMAKLRARVMIDHHGKHQWPLYRVRPWIAKADFRNVACHHVEPEVSVVILLHNKEKVVTVFGRRQSGAPVRGIPISTYACCAWLDAI